MNRFVVNFSSGMGFGINVLPYLLESQDGLTLANTFNNDILESIKDYFNKKYKKNPDSFMSLFNTSADLINLCKISRLDAYFRKLLLENINTSGVKQIKNNIQLLSYAMQYFDHEVIQTIQIRLARFRVNKPLVRIYNEIYIMYSDTLFRGSSMFPFFKDILVYFNMEQLTYLY